MPKKILWTITTIVLLCCLGIGFWIAYHKPLWNDEYYSLIASTSRISYPQIISGEISEGNNSPLYYLLQKVFLDLIRYDLPSQWVAGDWSLDNMYTRILLRIQPIIFMSLSIVFIFYFFVRHYSIWAALFSLFVYFSSYMLWIYWAEARPYALLVFLTTVQSLLFLKEIARKQWHSSWYWLALVHVLLSLTFVLSIGQILAVTFLLLMYKEKCKAIMIKAVSLLSIVPLIIILFYYMHAPKYSFWFDFSFEQLLRDNISRERFYIFFIFLFFMGLYMLSSRIQYLKQWFKESYVQLGWYFIFLTMVLIFTIFVLTVMYLNAGAPQTGFPISNRYFIYLMPIGILATTMVVAHWLRAVKSIFWAYLFSIGVITALFIPKFFKIVPRAIQSILGGA